MLFHTYRVSLKLHTASTFYSVTLSMTAIASIVSITQLSGYRLKHDTVKFCPSAN
jgi:hypothetical protein